MFSSWSFDYLIFLAESLRYSSSVLLMFPNSPVWMVFQWSSVKTKTGTFRANVLQDTLVTDELVGNYLLLFQTKENHHTNFFSKIKPRNGNVAVVTALFLGVFTARNLEIFVPGASSGEAFWILHHTNTPLPLSLEETFESWQWIINMANRLTVWQLSHRSKPTSVGPREKESWTLKSFSHIATIHTTIQNLVKVFTPLELITNSALSTFSMDFIW